MQQPAQCDNLPGVPPGRFDSPSLGDLTMTDPSREAGDLVCAGKITSPGVCWPA
jgi:hypothetical protein